MEIQTVDAVILGILLVGALIGLFAGFIRLVFWIAAWIGAALAAFWLLPMTEPLAMAYVQPDAIATVVAVAVPFLVVLVVIWTAGHMIAQRVRGTAIGPLDRSVGLLLGLILGAGIVSVLYLFARGLSPDDEPTWMAQSRLVPMARVGADMLYSLAPEELRAEGKAATQRIDSVGSATRDTTRGLRTLNETFAPAAGGGREEASPRPQEAPEGEAGYDAEERRNLDRLFENTRKP